jgi:FMN phosphatase YigB (HAD superfamily)
MKPLAIVFDLDDTLVDTFEQLIRPLEDEAAKAMVETGIDATVEGLTADIMRLRGSSPRGIEAYVRQKYPDAAEDALLARDKVFADPPVDALTLHADIRAMLERLSADCDIYLLTSGMRHFQAKKLKHLRLEEIFPESRMIIVESGGIPTKKSHLESLLAKYGDPKRILVVGNRADDEIAAGLELGMPVIWIRRGEGGEIDISGLKGRVDYIVNDIIDLVSHFKDY